MRFVFYFLNALLWFLLGATTILVGQYVRDHKLPKLPTFEKPAIVAPLGMPPIPKPMPEPPIIEIPAPTPDPAIRPAPVPKPLPDSAQPRRPRYRNR